MKHSPFLHDLLVTGKKEEVFPAAAASIVEEDEIEFATISMKPSQINVTEKTLFDVASLTKPLITATIILNLIYQGKLSFSSQLGETIEEAKNSFWEKTTVYQLLTHSSGLIGYRYFFSFFMSKGHLLQKNPKTKSDLLSLILKEKPVYKPGEKSIYSDFGYFLLGIVVERVTGTTLDNLAQDLIPDIKFSFNPEEKKAIPPTEVLSYRGGMVQGEVHDEHTFLVGGISGIAGLFISIEEISKFVQKIIHNLDYDTILPKPFFKEILQMKAKNSTWLPGWDTPSYPHSQGGSKIGNAIGHLGYTGCSIWIDVEKRMGIILLSNRTFPTRFNQKIKSFRPWFYDKIWENLK